MTLHSLSYKKIWQLSVPMIISNITVPLLGMTDIAVIGHLNNVQYMGGVNLGSSIISYIYWTLMFLRWSSSGFTAQAFGREDSEMISIVLMRAIFLAICIGTGLILFQKIIIYYALVFMHPSPSLKFSANEFLKIVIWGAPAAMMNYALVGWFIGLQKSKIPMFMLIVSNLIGVALDCIFVFYCHFDVAGVALATVIAQYSGVLIGLGFIFKLEKKYFCNILIYKIFELSAFKNFLIINQSIFIRSLSLCFVYAYFTYQSTSQGALILAVNAIIMNFQVLLACLLDGVANATEALIGEAIGKQQFQLLIMILRKVVICALLIAIIYSVVYGFFHQYLIAIMTTVTAVQQKTNEYIIWIIISPFISVWSFLLDGVFVGANRAWEMRNAMLVSAFLIFLPIVHAAKPWGNNGLWLAFFCFLMARAIIMAIMLWWLLKNNKLYA